MTAIGCTLARGDNHFGFCTVGILGCGFESACSMISTLSHLFRLGGVGLVCAREGLFSLVDPAPLPPQLRLVWRVGRLIERPSAVDPKHRLSTTVPALGPAYVKLGPVPGDPPRRGRSSARPGPKKPPGQDAAVFSGRG